jgi:hypothetical protein
MRSLAAVGHQEPPGGQHLQYRLRVIERHLAVNFCNKQLVIKKHLADIFRNKTVSHQGTPCGDLLKYKKTARETWRPSSKTRKLQEPPGDSTGNKTANHQETPTGHLQQYNSRSSKTTWRLAPAIRTVLKIIVKRI